MENDINNEWFSRVFNFKEPLYCPRCGTRFAVGPLFDHDPRICLSCNATLIELNMLSVVYVIDLERAPEIIKTLINYLAPLTETEAFNQLLTLFQFLHVDKIVELYGETERKSDTEE